MTESSRDPRFRYGSANFVGAKELKKAGMFKMADTAIYCGIFEGKPIYYDGDGGVILVAGARSGKLTDVLAQNICAGIGAAASCLILDMKGELACISRDQTPDRKYCYYFNPLGLHGFPQHRCNPVDYLKWSSKTLFADVKVFVEGLLPRTGSANAEYFELRAREYLEAICLTLIKTNGTLTLSDLYHAVNLIPLNDVRWKMFAHSMRGSNIPLCERIEEEIAAARGDSSGGTKGIMGEMFKALSCLSDPVLMEAVSPPYDFSLSELCHPKRKMHLYLMCPAETISPWSPITKTIFTGAMIYKSRSPNSPTQNWYLDECGQLENFEMIPRMYSYGAGIGIRPIGVFQTVSQMETLGKKARDIILSSAALQMFFAVRDLPSAEMVSKMMGAATLDYDDPVQQGRASIETRTILRALISGADPFILIQRLFQKLYESAHLSKLRRMLGNPDEIMRMPPDRMLVFADGLSGPICVRRLRYWLQRFMAGRYQGSPLHPPLDRVPVMTWWGKRIWRVYEEDVPEEFAEYPQYRESGRWSRVRKSKR